MGLPDPSLRDAMLAHLRTHHPSMCRHWFDHIEPIDVTNGLLLLLVRESVQLKYLQRCCVDQFKEAAQAVTGQLLAVRFLGEEDLERERVASRSATTAAQAPSAKTSTSSTGIRPSRTQFPSRVDRGDDHEMLLSPDYSFDNYIVGPDNRLAHAAAVAVAEQLGRTYNPLFLYSAVGLGKTHLLQAICHAALVNDPETRIYYTSCEEFKNQFHSAVQDGAMNDFRHRFRNVDILVIDDIHDLSKRETTQEEFFHTFNALYHAGRQIVLSSDASPNEIPDLEERLVSRFNSGLVARIDRPCFETRVQIVRAKAQLRGLDLPDDVASYIAAKIDSNIRELEGAITKVQSTAIVSGDGISLSLAKQAIGESVAPAGSHHPTIQQIVDAITRYYDVKLTDLLSKRRHKSIALPRQIGMWLARKHTRYSLEEIGGYFGGRDHTTVMHAVRSVNERRSGDTALDSDVTQLEQQILS